MIKVYDKNMKALGILENAYNIGYETPLNQVWSASFRLPLNDPKKDLCHHFNYVEVFDNGERVDLFRIMPIQTAKSESDRSISYQCEHVLACLHDDGIDDYVQWTNHPTETVLEDMLEYQEIKRFVLGNVDIRRFFHYGLEKEDLLPAIFSVVKPFDEPYQWTWDTTVFPWVLNLERASDEIVGEARWGRNIKGITKDSDPLPMATRIYPYGYGEGVNQLNIESVNPTGRRYIQDNNAVAQYGIIKHHWVDRRFENVESLYASAVAKLKDMCRPKVSYTADIVDLSALGDLNRFDVGKLVRIVDEDLGPVLQRVNNFSKPDIAVKWQITVDIGDKLEDLGTTQADLDRRQKINETYSQGATNIDSHNYADNCDPQHPAVIKFFLDEGLVNVNSMHLSYEVEAFRTYGRATEGGGSFTQPSTVRSESTASGGGGTSGPSSRNTAGPSSRETSASGGGGTSGPSSRNTSASGGGGTSGPSSRNTSSSAGLHRHLMFASDGDHYSDINPLPFYPFFARVASGQTIRNWIPNLGANSLYTFESSGEHTHQMDHTHTVPAHTHQMDHTHTVPAHTHQMDHTHNMDHTHTMPDHTHEFEVEIPAVEIPDHTHEIEHGIFVLTSTPSSVQIRVDGNLVPHTSTFGSDIDIIPYLAKDDAGKVTRGAWHEVTVTPNGLGRVTADVISRLFIQSRTGGKF